MPEYWRVSYLQVYVQFNHGEKGPTDRFLDYHKSFL